MVDMQPTPTRVFLRVFVTCIVLLLPKTPTAELVRVRHFEGISFGFLVLGNLDAQPIAYGYLKQVVKNGIVVDDLKFDFTDGSLYEEITKFTQPGEFRWISDQVVQKGPSFKQQMESWIDDASGNVTVQIIDNGKEKRTNKRLNLPADVSNGLLLTLVKNVNPSAETAVSMVAASSKPRLVKLNIVPAPEKTIKVGAVTHKAQHYIIKTKIGGAAGLTAPLVGKQPPDIHFWILKSEVPTFLEFEGPLSEDGPIWRIEMTAPEPDAPRKPE
jgi:hypothetical protein